MISRTDPMISKHSTKRNWLNPTRQSGQSSNIETCTSPYIIWRWFCYLPSVLTLIRQGLSARS